MNEEKKLIQAANGPSLEEIKQYRSCSQGMGIFGVIF